MGYPACSTPFLFSLPVEILLSDPEPKLAEIPGDAFLIPLSRTDSLLQILKILWLPAQFWHLSRPALYWSSWVSSLLLCRLPTLMGKDGEFLISVWGYRTVLFMHLRIQPWVDYAEPQ